MTNSILAKALQNAPVKTAPVAKSQRDNSVRNSDMREFIENADYSAFQRLPVHSQNKLNSLLATILQFLQNSCYIANGDLSTPTPGYEMLNFAIAKSIFSEFQNINSLFFNFSEHDKQVSQNAPLKSILANDLNASQKLILLKEIFSDLNAKLANANAKKDEEAKNEIA